MSDDHKGTLSPAEADALRMLDARGGAMLAQVEAWSAVNSGSRNLDGLARMADLLRDALAGLDGSVALRDAALVEAIDDAGRPYALAHGRNLHFVARPDAPLRALLVGHMDTVFGADHPFQSLRRIDANRLNGPGVADMKGGIAVMLAALEAFEASPFAADIGIEVVINADEEVSSLGSAPLLVEAARRCHVGLGYEPSQSPEGMLAGARKGSGNFSLAVHGRSAHAGRNPDDGRNAIVAASDLALRLAALSGKREGLSVNPARIDGGSANNVVPDIAVLRFNTRVVTEQDQLWVEDAIRAAVAEVVAAHEVTVDLHGGFARPPKPLDDHQLKLFDLVKACGGDLGLDLQWRASGGVCDGNNLAAQGLAVVDTLGVRGGAIHSADEYLLVDSLVERAKLSALILMRIAQRTTVQG